VYLRAATRLLGLSVPCGGFPLLKGHVFPCPRRFLLAPGCLLRAPPRSFPLLLERAAPLFLCCLLALCGLLFGP
jgi:hypothetical protein